MDGILGALVVGGIAGWLGGKIIKGGGQGLIMNIVIGIVGGVLGGWAFAFLGVTIVPGMVGSLITATIGAVLLLWIISKIKD
jgi:uncharacterized membrane protein YeaQ/YmgE (transglycosylase-associated protein family)